MGKKRELAQMLKQRKQMVLVEGNLKEFRERNRAEEEAERNPLREFVGGYRDEDEVEEVFASHSDSAADEPKKTSSASGSSSAQKAAAIQSPWRKVIDSKTKQPYYWNRATNQTTWKKPDDYRDEDDVPTSKSTTEISTEAKPTGNQSSGDSQDKDTVKACTIKENDMLPKDILPDDATESSQGMHTAEADKAGVTSFDKEEIEKRITEMKASLTSFELDKQIGRVPESLNAPNLDRLRFELDIRVADWREGEISQEYFLGKLRLLQEKIQSYEDSLTPALDSKLPDDFVPPLPKSPPPNESEEATQATQQNAPAEIVPFSVENWLPIWSEDYNQYYYMHVVTGDITWEPPQAFSNQPKVFEMNGGSSTPSTAEDSTKKEKTQKVSTISLKSKKMNNLVEKWKTLNASLPSDEDETKDTSEMNADELERTKLKKIEEWKQKQLEKISIAKENPNFTPLPVVDWRVRVNLAKQRELKKSNSLDDTQAKPPKK